MKPACLFGVLLSRTVWTGPRACYLPDTLHCLSLLFAFGFFFQPPFIHPTCVRSPPLQPPPAPRRHR